MRTASSGDVQSIGIKGIPVEKPTQVLVEDPDFVPYDTSTLSFAESGAGPLSAQVIRTVEWLTGKIRLLRIAKDFDKTGRKFETTIWEKVLELLEVDLQVTEEAIKKIPATGPVVVVANHPFGFVDGLVLTNLVCKVREDLKLLTRSFFATVPEIEFNMVPVAFPHDPDSQRKNVRMRQEIMEHLGNDGIVILFPAGRVATTRSFGDAFFGEAEEHSWNPFTAKMILKSRARVVPVYFPGQNGRAYQIAQTFSPTLRQSLMMHEIARSIGKKQVPVVGDPIEREFIDAWSGTQSEFMAHLRAHTLSLKDK